MESEEGYQLWLSKVYFWEVSDLCSQSHQSRWWAPSLLRSLIWFLFQCLLVFIIQTLKQNSLTSSFCFLWWSGCVGSLLLCSDVFLNSPRWRSIIVQFTTGKHIFSFTFTRGVKYWAMPGAVNISPAEFFFNPNQTHLNTLIKVWRVT